MTRALTLYVPPGAVPPVMRAAPLKREWMDETPQKFIYRCLPINIANQHGWELLCPSTFEALWTGGPAIGDVHLRGTHHLATTHFGSGVLTFHVNGIFRTEPGYNLWMGGSPNRPKDGITPLTGVIETDVVSMTATMNWRFTRTNTWITFEKGEPYAFIFPLRRGLLETVECTIRSMDEDPKLLERYQAWSASRGRFNAGQRDERDWQGHYFRGQHIDGEPFYPPHETKLRLDAPKQPKYVVRDFTLPLDTGGS